MVRRCGGRTRLLEAGQIREPATVTILPPREGFAPHAIGAIGMMVRLMAAPDDIIVGADPGSGAFATPRFMPILPVLWPPFGRTARYMAGAIARLRTLRPRLIEVHNRANLARDIAAALPDSRVLLFLHNDPQTMRGARIPAERAALLACMTVVCVSNHLRARFAQGLPPGAGPILHLPNAIDLAALPQRLPPGQRDPAFLFVGRAVADKGADAFVRAFAAVSAQLPGWRATLIGADRFRADSPDTPFLRTLRPAASAARVTLAGHLPHRAVLAEMARAAIVVVPSRWAEPFGLTALEAMASGAALICAPTGGLPEVAGEAALYATADPPGPLEHAMLTLAQDPARRAAYAAAGQERACQFDAPTARARLQALRAATVESGHRRGHTKGPEAPDPLPIG